MDLSDLSELLSPCLTICGPPSPLTGSVSTSIAGYDTGGYIGSGFNGETYDFVFGVIVTINTSADDWAGSGVRVTAANGATFRLVADPNSPPVPTSSTPQKNSTFFSVPYSANANSRFNSPFPSGGIAGRYSSTASAYTYGTSTVDAAWYDLDANSNDGPAGFRLVINVASVSGANTSGGFGSVYFTTGSPGSGDIKVADMTFQVTHKYADSSGPYITTGSFYVTD